MAELTADPLFTQDVVMDFMLSKDGGKVTNHELVNHFKNFLNDPIRKVANRQQFKTYVNNLSTVKLDVTGEKVLVLKKKFKDDINFGNNIDQAVSNSKTFENTSVKSNCTVNKESETSSNIKKEETIPTKTVIENSKEIVQEESGNINTALNNKSETIQLDSEKLSSVSVSQLEKTEIKKVETKPQKDENKPNAVNTNKKQKAKNNEFSISMVPMFGSNEFSSDFQKEESVNKKKSDKPIKDGESLKAQSESKLFGIGEAIKGLHLFSDYANQSSSDTTLNVTNDNKIENKKPKSLDSVEMRKVEEVSSSGPHVKELALNLNRVENETIKINGAISALAANNKTKRETRKAHAGDSIVDSDLSPLTTIDREWILKSSSSDYQAMSKMLQQHPHLAAKRDFVTGYNALHWAAKNGQTDLIKMLCGNYSVDVNQRTQGGYTALHLASQSGHEQVIELLIRVYAADANMRDYSGRLAKFYLSNQASVRAQHLIMPRKPVSAINSTIPNRSNRLGSFRSINQSEGKENTTPFSPSSLKPFRHEDFSSLMPPPQLAPINRRKPASKISDKSAYSDSEMAAEESASPMLSSITGSNPNLGTIV